MLKLSIRGKTIAYSTHKKRSREQEERELEKNLENLYIKFEQNPSVENDVYIREAEENLKNVREEKIKGLIARAKAKWHVEGEKSTRFFFAILRKDTLKKT